MYLFVDPIGVLAGMFQIMSNLTFAVKKHLRLTLGQVILWAKEFSVPSSKGFIVHMKAFYSMEFRTL